MPERHVLRSKRRRRKFRGFHFFVFHNRTVWKAHQPPAERYRYTISVGQGDVSISFGMAGSQLYPSNGEILPKSPYAENPDSVPNFAPPSTENFPVWAVSALCELSYDKGLGGDTITRKRKMDFYQVF